MSRFKTKKVAGVLAAELADSVGLKHVQGELARKRARARAWAVWRAIHDVVDHAFPSIKKATKRKTKAKTKRAESLRKAHKIQTLNDRGYVVLHRGADVWRHARNITVPADKHLLETLAMNGVTVRRVGLAIYVPSWACITKNDTKLRQARRSRGDQEALRALFKVAEENL